MHIIKGKHNTLWGPNVGIFFELNSKFHRVFDEYYDINVQMQFSQLNKYLTNFQWYYTAMIDKEL